MAADQFDERPESPSGDAGTPVPRAAPEAAPSGFERRIEWRPAYDKRSSDPGKNYGIGAMKIMFYLIGSKGAIQWVISTGWYLEANRESLRESERSFHARHGYSLSDTFGPQAFDLGYHAKEPQYEDQSPMDHCDLLGDGRCYYDGSTLNAERLVEGFLSEGPDYVWAQLEDYYASTFATALATTPAADLSGEA